MKTRLYRFKDGATALIDAIKEAPLRAKEQITEEALQGVLKTVEAVANETSSGSRRNTI